MELVLVFWLVVELKVMVLHAAWYDLPNHRILVWRSRRRHFFSTIIVTNQHRPAAFVPGPSAKTG